MSLPDQRFGAGGTPRDRLNSYIAQIEERLRKAAILQGAAIVASSALIATFLLVLVTNHFAFSSGSMTGARAILLVILVCAAGFGLYLPLSRLGRRNAALRAESAFAQFQQRLVTFVERDKKGDPFIELLAGDALETARGAEPAQLAPDKRLQAFLGIGIASFGVLIWMILAGPGFLGAGASLLWTGAHAGKSAFYDVRVTPGNASVRRNADEMVTAEPLGIQTDKVRLFARYQSASKWEEVTMEPQAGSSSFQFLFAGLPESVEYYVEAGPVRSKHYNLHVTDQAAVKQIRVTYHYPSWTLVPAAVEEHGGDLRAVAGTQADLEIQMDRPLSNGMLVLDDDQQIQLSGGANNRYKASIKMEKDGAYHVATLDQGQSVRLSEDFFIEANKANPPVIEIDRPGHDYRSSPIEEVTISVKGADDYGLSDMALHYSVNGGPDQTVNLLKEKGAKQADGSTTLYMENFKVVPGDLVSLYATAKDANAESHTDISFVQVDPFEREFSQSQSGGGGGGRGGQGDQADISQREKEIIAATWKQQTNRDANAQQAADQSKFLSGVQTKLREQALSLSDRLQSRDLTEQNQEFNDFQRDMNSAAEAMSPASDKLKAQQWHDAIPAEQKALQYLLRAEATFRQIQVAFGQNGGGGGGGGGAGRDLASLFDLELDTEKNQYETAQTASPADQHAKDIDDAMKKLDDLARREEELAQQRNGTDQTFQQRWQQEMLRREAEELQKQIEQMQKNGQQGSNGSNASNGSGGQSSSSGSQSSSQGGSQSGSQGGQSGSSGSSGGQSSASASNGSDGSQSGSPNADDPRVQQALNQLRHANEDMRRAASQQKSDADARSAAERLRQATNLLGETQQQQNSGKLDSLSQEADGIANEERDQADRMRKMGGGGGNNSGMGNSSRAYGGSQGQSLGNYNDMQKMANERQKLADDVAGLDKQMRDAARQMDSSQRAASSKLRDALGSMEQNDLETRIQRSADWLRRGINPTSNSNEGEVASELQQLSDQVRQAQQALGSGGQQQKEGDNSDVALDRVERLRNELQALDPSSNRRNGQGNQRGQDGNRPGQGGQPGSQQNNLQANSLGRGSQSGQGGQNSAANGQTGQLGARGGTDNGGGRLGGDDYGGNVVGGGDRDHYRGGWWGFDTGNNSNLPQPVSPDTSPVPPDPERAYQQSLRELNQLHQTVQNDPEIDRQVQELIQEMQHLDPSRFPGNPALVEQLHTQVLSDVDKLELQLRRNEDDKGTGQIRSSDSVTVPSGYQDAVAEYFRRLSKNQQ